MPGRNSPRQSASRLTVAAREPCVRNVILRRQPKNLVANLPALTEENETPRYTRGDKERRIRSNATGVLLFRRRGAGGQEIRLDIYYRDFYNGRVR